MNYCGRGVRAAEKGHEGTCDQASGWDEEPLPAYAARVLAAIRADKTREQLWTHGNPQVWEGDYA